MELGNHAEFLDIMSFTEMLAMYFVHDAGETQKWRLKGHAIERFYEFISSWAIMYSHPRDIGFEMNGFDLPELSIIEKQVSTPIPEGQLFSGLRQLMQLIIIQVCEKLKKNALHKQLK